MENRTKKAFLILVLWALAGCAALGGHYGTILPDADVRQSFEAFIMDPGMNYYYSGPDNYPNAVIGLKKDYALDNDLWKPMEPDPKRFRQTIGAMQEEALRHGSYQHGFLIRDYRGQAIGVWYSILSVKTKIVKSGTDNKVVVYTPELIIYPGEGGGAGRRSPR